VQLSIELDGEDDGRWIAEIPERERGAEAQEATGYRHGFTPSRGTCTLMTIRRAATRFTHGPTRNPGGLGVEGVAVTVTETSNEKKDLSVLMPTR